METFAITIIDPAHVAGIAAAREAYSASRSGDDPVIATNEEYMQFVVVRAAESYAKQYGAEAA